MAELGNTTWMYSTDAELGNASWMIQADKVCACNNCISTISGGQSRAWRDTTWMYSTNAE